MKAAKRTNASGMDAVLATGARARSPIDLSFITPSLAMGGRLGMDGAEHLADAHGVRRVVDLRVEEQDDPVLLDRHGIELLLLPTEDLAAVAEEAIDAGVSWVNAQLACGERVYVHCEHGIGRSALLVCCVLVSHGHTPKSALALAKRARTKVSPSPEQLGALLAWATRWRGRTGRPRAEDTLAELFEIAYAHLRESGSR